MSKIKNEKVEVENSIELNDQDILNDILETEKNMSNNLSIALNEMSNKVLFKEIFDIFKDTKDLAREAYCIAFQNGWYTLETVEENKISQAYKEYNDKLSQL
mgnify:FL=1